MEHVTTTLHNRVRPLNDNELPPIAIGILSYNRAAEVIASIDIVRASDYPPDRLHIIVVDNDSTDGTQQIVHERYGGDVEVIGLPENMGAVARNRAILTRGEPYIFMFDEDCAPQSRDTVRGIVSFMEANPYFGALCLRSINHFSGKTEYEGWEHLSRRRLQNGGYEGVYVAGNGMCFRRDAIQMTDGYDERIFWGSEEFCLGLELLYHDISVAYLPEYALVHRRAPRAYPPARVLEAEARNNIWAPFLFFPFPIALLVASTHTARRFLVAWLRARPDGPKAVARGVGEAIRGLPEMLSRRKLIPISRLAQYNRWFINMLHS